LVSTFSANSFLVSILSAKNLSAKTLSASIFLAKNFSAKIFSKHLVGKHFKKQGIQALNSGFEKANVAIRTIALFFSF